MTAHIAGNDPAPSAGSLLFGGDPVPSAGFLLFGGANFNNDPAVSA